MLVKGYACSQALRREEGLTWYSLICTHALRGRGEHGYKVHNACEYVGSPTWQHIQYPTFFCPSLPGTCTSSVFQALSSLRRAWEQGLLREC